MTEMGKKGCREGIEAIPVEPTRTSLDASEISRLDLDIVSAVSSDNHPLAPCLIDVVEEVDVLLQTLQESSIDGEVGLQNEINRSRRRL